MAISEQKRQLPQGGRGGQDVSRLACRMLPQNIAAAVARTKPTATRWRDPLRSGLISVTQALPVETVSRVCRLAQK